jgi:hypothetical protein
MAMSTTPGSTPRRLTGAIELPDGSWVRGRGLRDTPPDRTRGAPEGLAPELGLYLGGRRSQRRYDPALRWPHEWIHWPDFLLPRDPEAAVRHIHGLAANARAGRRVEVACYGGVGRTGTVIACLAVVAGLTPDDAIDWAREHHHHRAVETPWQRRWVHRFPPTGQSDQRRGTSAR